MSFIQIVWSATKKEENKYQVIIILLSGFSNVNLLFQWQCFIMFIVHGSVCCSNMLLFLVSIFVLMIKNKSIELYSGTLLLLVLCSNLQSWFRNRCLYGRLGDSAKRYVVPTRILRDDGKWINISCTVVKYLKIPKRRLVWILIHRRWISSIVCLGSRVSTNLIKIT